MSKKSKPVVVLVGCGHLGHSMIKAWEEKLSRSFQFIVVGRHRPKDLARSTKYISAEKGLAPNTKPAAIIFAVRPRQLNDTAKAYQQFAHTSLFISVAAGRTLASLEKVLGKKARIIRTMPNLPANIGQAITGAVVNQSVTKQDKKLADTLLKAFGEVVWVKRERQINAINAISGSGPGYVFLFAAAMMKTARSLGLSATDADKLVRHTLAGSSNLLKNSPLSPDDLCTAIATKGGTTEAAFNVFNKGNQFQKLVMKALKAAQRKAEEPSKV